MTDDTVRDIAQDTLECIEKGFYTKDGKTVSLREDDEGNACDCTAALVFTSEKLKEIQDRRAKQVRDRTEPYRTDLRLPTSGYIAIMDLDALRGAKYKGCRGLVLSCANALRPGGGFPEKNESEEACICGRSTLYMSLTSPHAKPMYEHNRSKNAIDAADWIAIAPDVLVFKDIDGTCFDAPYRVSVASVPVPETAAGSMLTDVDRAMEERLQAFFAAAWSAGYTTLYIGPWGPASERTAQYLRRVLLDKKWKWKDAFEMIILAIPDPEERACYERAFEGHADLITDEIIEQEEKRREVGIAEFRQDLPHCSYEPVDMDGKHAYAQGVTRSGVPFVAEQVQLEGRTSLVVVMPHEIPDDAGLPSPVDPFAGSPVTALRSWQPAHIPTVLDIEMTDCGVEEDQGRLARAMRKMEALGLVEFTDPFCYGAVQYLLDLRGKEVAKILVILSEEAHEYARTPLTFRPFPNQQKDADIVPFPTGSAAQCGTKDVDEEAQEPGTAQIVPFPLGRLGKSQDEQ